MIRKASRSRPRGYSRPNDILTNLSATTRYVISAAILLAGTGLFFMLHSESSFSGGFESRAKGQDFKPDLETIPHTVDSSKPLRTKSRIRDSRTKPTVEQTADLFRETILSLVDLPKQTFAARVVELNRLIKESGVSPENLRISIEDGDSALERPLARCLYPELRIRNIPLADVLKYTADSTALRYEVLPGRVECFQADSADRIHQGRVSGPKTSADGAGSIPMPRMGDESSDSEDPFKEP
jgi:hypothetical protein